MLYGQHPPTPSWEEGEQDKSPSHSYEEGEQDKNPPLARGGRGVLKKKEKNNYICKLIF
jgi:hypothetical protein